MVDTRTQSAIKKAFVDAGITPMQSGVWKKYVPTSFMPKGSPAACQILNQVCKLQDKRAISAYLFACGLDDQNPEDWGDVDSLRAEGLVIPDVDGLSSEEEGEGDMEDEMEEEEEGELEETEEKEPEETEENETDDNALNLRLPSPELLSSSDDDEEYEAGQMEETQRDLRAQKRCRR